MEGFGADAERAIEFDQSQLFRKVYSEEFDTPGGQPFAALIGDYQVRPWPTAEHPQDDVAVLTAISHVAAAAFAPFVAGVHPAMFGLDDFGELERPRNLSTIFDQLEYLKWRTLRESEDSRFVGLTLPRMLMRLPYRDQGTRPAGFVFHEEVAGPDRGKYLWGNAAYAFGGVLIRSFAGSGWLADIRGVVRGVDGGGLVSSLPVHSFSTDPTGIVPKSSTEVVIADAQEQELSELGFIALCHCQDSEYSAFYTNQSIQKPRRYDRLAATMNAADIGHAPVHALRLAFAHYLKVLRGTRSAGLPRSSSARVICTIGCKNMSPRIAMPRRRSSAVSVARGGRAGPRASGQTGLLRLRRPSLAALRAGRIGRRRAGDDRADSRRESIMSYEYRG